MPGSLVTYLANVSKWVDGVYAENPGLGEDVASTSQRIVGGSILLLFILMAIAVLARNSSEKFKFILFTMMATVMAGSTLMLATSSIYLNTNSDSNGLTKRQAGIEFWVCGNEINLIDPSGISNKVGSSTLYEQNDKLVYVEGVVVNENIDGTLGKFMHEVGGAVLGDALIIPVNPDGSIFATDTDSNGPANPYSSEAEKFLTLSGNSRYVKTLNGQFCGTQAGEVQIFVYNFDEDANTYEQTKIERPQEYVFADEKSVPPGDCVIVEFDTQKEQTDKLCYEYEMSGAQQINYSPIGSGIDPNVDKEVSQ